MPSQKEVNKFLTKFRGGTIQKEIDALIKKFGLSNAKAKDMAISYNASGGPDPRLSPWGPADMPEEAPANATGTAVAGTGDDSSTVVVKRIKKMQDNSPSELRELISLHKRLKTFPGQGGSNTAGAEALKTWYNSHLRKGQIKNDFHALNKYSEEKRLLDLANSKLKNK